MFKHDASVLCELQFTGHEGWREKERLHQFASMLAHQMRKQKASTKASTRADIDELREPVLAALCLASL